MLAELILNIPVSSQQPTSSQHLEVPVASPHNHGIGSLAQGTGELEAEWTWKLRVFGAVCLSSSCLSQSTDFLLQPRAE